MAVCSNCGSKLGCGCQKRVLDNGSQGCVNCAGKQPQNINKAPRVAVKDKKITVTPQGKSPTPLNVWGKDRYIKLEKFTK
jgi:hypothetical protein